MNPILELIIVTLLPFLELRASIPYGILGLGMNWTTVFIVCVITNIILGIVVYFFIDYIVLLAKKIKFIGRMYDRYVEKTQKKIDKYVEKYGEWSVAVFIGIPLPGSGVYSGALAAHLIGLKKRKFLIANIVGVLIAGVIVTIISVSGSSVFEFFIKRI